MLSIVIPAKNEMKNLESLVDKIYQELHGKIDNYEIIFIDDYSTDETHETIEQVSKNNSKIKYYKNHNKPGFGNAISAGIERSTGTYLTIVMADLSDSFKDVKSFYEIISKKKIDCVFGTRFHPEAVVKDYPLLKMIINRLLNNFIKILFRINYNDVSNAFKMYRRENLVRFMPFYSESFNITLELPLRMICNGYSYIVIPNSWKGRTNGKSKLNMAKMLIPYLKTLIACYQIKIRNTKR